jgi:hypothetical protein
MKRYIIFFLFIGVALFLIGCKPDPAKFTGGGSIICDGEKVANVGFVYNNCKEEPMLNLLYNDKDAGVKFKAGPDFIGTPDGFLLTSYTSKDGDGTVQIWVKDLGEGNIPHGAIEMLILDGPLAPYFVAGIVEGNIQEHECDD